MQHPQRACQGLVGDSKLELYHGVTSSFFCIGILLVSDLMDFWNYGRYCCTVNFGGNIFLSFCGIFFFEKFRGNSFLFFKRRVKCSKRGLMPPLLRKKGAPANFLRGSRQIFDTENTDWVFLRYGIGNTGEILTEYRPKIPNWYTTLEKKVSPPISPFFGTQKVETFFLTLYLVPRPVYEFL